MSNNPQAFPGGTPSRWDGQIAGGMTLRDWFAGHAMNSLMSARTGLEMDLDQARSLLAKAAYMFADAMLAERGKGCGL